MFEIAFTNENGHESQLCLDSGKLKRFTNLQPKVISITNYYHPDRRDVEDFISSIYKTSFNAEISSHYPILMSVRDNNNKILAALGFRLAEKENLFLEQYLDSPVEMLLSHEFNKTIERESIVEVGNLASCGNGASIFLFSALAAYLKYQGYEYVSVTATQFLQNYFETIGLNPVLIAKADQNKLADSGASWGSYYSTNPKVLAGTISSACLKLKKFLNMEFKDNQPQLLPRLHYKS